MSAKSKPKLDKTGQFPAYKAVPVEKLIPYARNARTHSAEQVAQIAASIKEFGFLNPIITDGENGRKATLEATGKTFEEMTNERG